MYRLTFSVLDPFSEEIPEEPSLKPSSITITLSQEEVETAGRIVHRAIDNYKKEKAESKLKIDAVTSNFRADFVSVKVEEI